MLMKWECLPSSMHTNSVKKYYEILEKRRISLIMKRFLDFFIAVIILAILSPLFFLISIAIKIDSKGSIVFSQIRITQYGKRFKIFKFRTMVDNAQEIGFQITTENDKRITKVGRILRKFRLDEIPQLFNVITGDMSFVGTRPEVPKYVEQYTEEMMATLLLPAGITSEASIQYKNEALLLSNTDNTEETYINEILPEKMRYNLKSIENFSFSSDIKIMVRTIFTVLQRDKATEKVPYMVTSDKNKHL